MSNSRLLLLAVLVLGLTGFYLLDGWSWLSLGYAQSRLDLLRSFRDQHFVLSLVIYFLTYVLLAALSIPAALIITLLGGAVFGVFWGTLLASFASAIGATMAFVVSRTLLRDWVQSRFGDYLAPINRGMERDGNFYLFSIRMVPIFPFFMVNLLMGLTPMGIVPFYLVSQAGMLLLTVVYVNVGAELGQISSLSGLLSVPVMLSLTLVGIMPLLARLLIRALGKLR